MERTYKALIKIREVKEREKLLAFSEVGGLAERSRNQISAYYSESENYLKQESDKMRQGMFSVRDMMDLQHYLNSLALRKKVAEQKLEELKPELERRRAELMAARKDKRIAEILLERKQEEKKKELLKKESEMLDEHNEFIHQKKESVDE